MRIKTIDWRPEILGTSGFERDLTMPHMSEIRDGIAAEIGDAFKQRGGSAFNDKAALFEMGFTWEVALEDAFAHRMRGYKPQLSIEHEGILFSPDGGDKKKKLGYEFKLTFRSYKKFDLANEWKWLMQIKTYCKALSAHYGVPVRRFVVVVMFVNGDYGANMGPVCKTWQITFTKKDIWDTWQQFIGFAREKGIV